MTVCVYSVSLVLCVGNGLKMGQPLSGGSNKNIKSFVCIPYYKLKQKFHTYSRAVVLDLYETAAQ
jgi:hypothetical protein